MEGNPIVGYSKLKNCVRLLFWSGQSFGEPILQNEGSFKAAELRYTAADQIDIALLQRCLQKAAEIQWDYKNLVKRKGQLEALKGIDPENNTTKSPYGKKKYSNIAEYHADFAPEIRQILEDLHSIIKNAAPQATETISYNMPAFKINSVLVYYAAYAKHIGFYPTNAPITAFKDELTNYKTSKGAIQFPLHQPLPAVLIAKIVAFRVAADAVKK